jgi:hypothetical protein
MNDQWRSDITASLRKVSVRVGPFKFRDITVECYRKLEQTAHVDLSGRLDKYKQSLKANGANKTAMKRANRLDVIDADPQLRIIYNAIVKDLVRKYCN